MGLIFESEAVRQRPTEAATHVLLIGCGEYPSQSRSGLNASQPLNSPRRSVEAMAKWFLSGPDAMPLPDVLPANQAFCNPEAPLGSLELLASPTQDYTTPSGVVASVTRPTLVNIREAYKRWIARLGNNPQSRGVFYFCGHGVGDGIDQYDVWSGSFHVSNTCQAAIRKTSANLFFLIDACVEFDSGLVFSINSPKGLGGGVRNGNTLSSEWLVLRASTANRVAYADGNGIARFTSALLLALQGFCGRQRPGGSLFDVTGSQLREATAAFLARLQQPGDGRWQKLGSPHGDGAWDIGLHVLDRRPLTLVELDVEPEGFRGVAEAFVERNGTHRDQRPLSEGPAHFAVPRGEWTFGACAPRNEFAAQSCPEQFLSQAVISHRFLIP
jgi:hypothetical protein